MALPASLRIRTRRALRTLARVRAAGPSHPVAARAAGPYASLFDAEGRWAPVGLVAFGRHGPLTTLRAMEALLDA
jgi:hypothetical protein